MAQEITVGGGSSYRPTKGFARATIPTGASGVIIDITAGLNANDAARLEMLSESGTGGQSGITVEIDGVEFITGELSATPSDGQFNLLQSGATGNTNCPFTDIVGKSIKVIKNSGVTVSDIVYVYSTGELK